MGRGIFISEDNQLNGSRHKNLPIICGYSREGY
jgi:hypothetical protein